MNAATLIVILIVALAVVAALLIGTRPGKKSCGCGCEGCTYKDNCGK